MEKRIPHAFSAGFVCSEQLLLSQVPPWAALCLLGYAAQDAVWNRGTESPNDESVVIWVACVEQISKNTAMGLFFHTWETKV